MISLIIYILLLFFVIPLCRLVNNKLAFSITLRSDGLNLGVSPGW